MGIILLHTLSSAMLNILEHVYTLLLKFRDIELFKECIFECCIIYASLIRVKILVPTMCASLQCSYKLCIGPNLLYKSYAT